MRTSCAIMFYPHFEWLVYSQNLSQSVFGHGNGSKLANETQLAHNIYICIIPIHPSLYPYHSWLYTPVIDEYYHILSMFKTKNRNMKTPFAWRIYGCSTHPSLVPLGVPNFSAAHFGWLEQLAPTEVQSPSITGFDAQIVGVSCFRSTSSGTEIRNHLNYYETGSPILPPICWLHAGIKHVLENIQQHIPS